MHSRLAALRIRNVRLLLLGNLIGSFGLQMQSTAVGWELYDRTHSAYALGFVGLVQVLPLFALVLHAGHFVDTHDRRRVLIAAVGGFALAALGLAVVSFGRAPVPLLYGCLLITGIARALSAPARTALLPALVPPEQLADAVTWNSGGFQLAAVAGPAAAGGLIALTRSAAPVYLLTALCGVTYVMLVLRVRYRDEARGTQDLTWHDLLGGVRFVWHTPLVLSALTLDLLAVLLGGATTLLPVYAKDILHTGPAGLGLLDAAPSVGALCVAVWLASARPMRRAGRTLLFAVTGFGIGTIVFGLSRWMPLSLVALAALGGVDMVSVVIRATLVPLVTPDEMRGRVGAVNSLFIGTSNQLGGFESGVVAGAFGPVFSVVVGGIGTLAIVALAAWHWPELRRLTTLRAAGESVRLARPTPEQIDSLGPSV